MKPDDSRWKQLSPPAPREYAGQWVAWSTDKQEIVAHGLALNEVIEAAHAAGHAKPIFQKVISRYFVGRR